MGLVPSDRLWIVAATTGPLQAVSISLAEQPDACDATPRGQDICEAILEQLVLLRFKDTRS
jgi:hypothetical protein